MVRPIVHFLLHFVVPGVAARWLFADKWKSAWLVMVLTMVIDLDHLIASPIYDPNRCGIGFHPLHSYVAIGLYIALAIIVKTRIVGIGLLIHVVLDGIDCLWMRLS
ncbi:MAG: DUF6122 family protein [Desulfobacterales bacterium]|nr:DUF6122 family protein [Desulfobacterales bacterium]